MKLIVLAGAKQGTEIPLRKEKFIIGRASDCTLRAGSDAISRYHCAIVRREQGTFASDLGSRNGTFVNGNRIDSETLLSSGDTLRVGPLEFQFHAAHDIRREKKPAVKDVAEAVQRVAERAPDEPQEDDISRWLLGPDPGSKATRETQTFRLDDTTAMGKPSDSKDLIDEANDSKSTIEIPEELEDKKGGKPKPGKLPPLPPKHAAKDSREAAADILREMTRRR